MLFDLNNYNTVQLVAMVFHPNFLLTVVDQFVPMPENEASLPREIYKEPIIMEN